MHSASPRVDRHASAINNKRVTFSLIKVDYNLLIKKLDLMLNTLKAHMMPAAASQAVFVRLVADMTKAKHF